MSFAIPSVLFAAGSLHAVNISTTGANKGPAINSAGTAWEMRDFSSATLLTSGSLPDARLSANVPLLNLGNTFALGTIVTSKPQLITQTWNDSGVNFTALKVNVTDSAFASPSYLLDLQLSSSSIFSFNRNGNFTATGSIIGGSCIITSGSITRSSTATLSLGGTSFSTAGTMVNLCTATNSNTSGTMVGLSITPTYNQSSGTAANTDLLINRTQTAVGSGTQLLIDAQVAGVSKFSVDNTGIVTGIGSGLTNLNASNISTGTLSTSRISLASTNLTDSSNIARLNATQSFTAANNVAALRVTYSNTDLSLVPISIQFPFTYNPSFSGPARVFEWIQTDQVSPSNLTMYALFGGGFYTSQYIVISNKRSNDGSRTILGVSALGSTTEPSMLSIAPDVNGPAIAVEASSSLTTGQTNAVAFATYDIDDQVESGYGKKKFAITGNGTFLWGTNLGLTPGTAALAKQVFNNGTGDLEFWTGATLTKRFYVSDAGSVVVNGGKLGIGTNNSPSWNLTVQNSSGAVDIALVDSGGNANTITSSGGSLLVTSPTGKDMAFRPGGSETFRCIASTGASVTGTLTVSSNLTVTGNTRSAKLGLGMAPSEVLDVTGNIQCVGGYIYANGAGNSFYCGGIAVFRGSLVDDTHTYMSITGGTSNYVYMSGRLGLGSGKTAPGEVLDINGNARISGNLGVGNSATATVAVGTLTKKIEIFDASGTSLGYIPVYATIT